MNFKTAEDRYFRQLNTLYQDGAVLQTVTGSGCVQGISWFSDSTFAVAFTRSKVSDKVFIHLLCNVHYMTMFMADLMPNRLCFITYFMLTASS